MLCYALSMILLPAVGHALRAEAVRGLSFPQNLGTKSLVRALLRGNYLKQGRGRNKSSTNKRPCRSLEHDQTQVSNQKLTQPILKDLVVLVGSSSTSLLFL